MKNQETQCAQVAMIHENGDISVQWEGGTNDAKVETISNDIRNGLFTNTIVGDWLMIQSVRNNDDSSRAIKTIVDVKKTREPSYSEGERATFWSKVQ